MDTTIDVVFPLNPLESGFDQAFFQHFFVAEPEVGDIGRAEAENVLKRAANFGQVKIHAETIQKVDTNAPNATMQVATKVTRGETRPSP